MINRSEAFALLLEACPAARGDWEEHQREWPDEDVPYLGMAVFSRHVVGLMSQGETDIFPKVFAAVEKLIVEGDEEVRGLAVVGFLEGLQNQASWTEQGSDTFRQWLRPSTNAAWHELSELWAGKDSLGDVIRDERRREG